MKMPFTENLPVQAVLPEFRQALKSHNQIILSAAPGAGKTTLIPPVCAEELSGNIRLIEPRRVAARAAACRIAELNDTPVGTFSGYAVRGESRRGEGTRILSVTPGILIREFQSDPLLEGVDAVIFDEFHERSWECDLLLTLALEIQSALRPELKIIIMSATLAAERLKNFLPEAAVINSSGREYPVEIVYKAPENPQAFDSIVLSCVRAAAELFRAQDTGDILVFLPGAGEISRSAAALREILKEADIRELHGALEFREQNKVLQKSAEGRRRIFLATNLAESSITIDGVTAVVDSGWEKRMTYSPASGMSFLELQRISRASAIQRAGRAGRTAPGKAVRLFSQIDFNNFPEQAPPEISVCDLTQLALNLADWGAVPADLRWLDAPPVPGMELSWKLLQKLGALTEENRPTAHGRALNKLPLHPRLGSMLLRAKEENLKSTACAIAALLENRTAGRDGADIRPLLEEMKYHPERWGARKTVMKQLLHLLGGPADEIEPEMAGRLLSWAYPEWIGQKRDGNTASYRLAGGRAGELDPKDPLFGEEFLSVAVLGGTSGKSVMIRLAAPLDRATLEKDFGSRLTRENVFDFDAETERVTAREELKLDALVLSSRAIPLPPGAAGKAVLAAAVKRKLLLPPENFKKARQLIDRVRFAGLSDPEAGFPDWSDEKWPEVLTDMTAGYLENVRSISDLLKLDWDHIVSGALPYEQLTMLEKLYPEFFTTPRGYRIRIDYSGENPAAAVRIQELYGVTVHPVIGRSHIPLRLELLSPARRPVQITMDLPGFWKGSWSLVRKDMRGRYPKHDWPEHPENEK